MSSMVSTDASQHTGPTRDEILQVPGRDDNPTPIGALYARLPTPPKRIIRTLCYDVKTTQSLLRAVEKLRHDQRAVYNHTISSVDAHGGAIPAVQKSIKHPDGLYGQLTQWREKGDSWFTSIPVSIARPAVVQAHGALKAHEDALCARLERLLEEDEQWQKWLEKHPGWDSGAWDRLDRNEKRLAIKNGEAPPKCISIRGDERNGDGSKDELHRTRKAASRCAVVWHTPPRRSGVDVVRLPGLKPDIEVRTRQGLPPQQRLKAAKLCLRKGRNGKPLLRLHVAVATDVEAVRRKEHVVAGADAGTGDTFILHDGWRLTLPDHNDMLEKAIETQRHMSRCHKGSRRWNTLLDRLRHLRRTMTARDHDSVRKAGRELALRWNILGLESLPIVTMGASAKGRGGINVNAKTALNKSIRRALWGFAKKTVEAAFESAGGAVILVPAAYSSQTCSRCGHTDAENRNGKDFWCQSCGYLDDADENAAAVIRQRSIEWEWLRRSGHSPGSATEILWKTAIGEARRCAKDAKKTHAAAHESENQTPGGKRPTHHTAGRVPRRSAIKAGQVAGRSPDCPVVQSTQPAQHGTNNSSV
jgi:putative transposase